jgi:thioredoxin-like negative regulator of GroEL
MNRTVERWTFGRHGALPCRMAAPEVHELAREMGRRGLVRKVNTKEYSTLATQFRVQSILYFVLLRRGIIIAERTGVAPRAEMGRWFAMAACPGPQPASVNV